MRCGNHVEEQGQGDGADRHWQEAAKVAVEGYSGEAAAGTCLESGKKRNNLVVFEARNYCGHSLLGALQSSRSDENGPVLSR